LDSGEAITLTDLSNIGVTGVGGADEPTLSTLNSALNGEENSDDVQTLVDSLQDKEDALIRMENGALIEGDLTLLGITNISDDSTHVAQINNVLSDTTIDEQRDLTQLQNIANALVKLENGIDLTQAEFTLLGLDNLSSEDVADLNMALRDSDALALGTTPTTNLQTILDSLNRLDSGEAITLTDLSNIGVTGVGGADEPTLDALNRVLDDVDVSADDTNSVQAVVDSLLVLNLTNENSSSLTATDLEILGIRASDGTVSTDELRYINNRIAENSDSNTQGDGNFANDTAELQALVDNIDSGTFHFGDSGTNSFTYSSLELYDGGEGVDLVYVNGGDSVKIEDLHNIESIVLNVDNSSNDTDLASALGDITIQDVIDITDGGNVLTIDENDGVSNDTVERVFLDSNDFQTDEVLDAEGYYNYVATDGSGVTVRISELIVVE